MKHFFNTQLSENLFTIKVVGKDYKKMSSETDVAPKAISGIGLDGWG